MSCFAHHARTRAAAGRTREVLDLSYAAPREREFHLDLYLPAEQIGRPPLVMWIPGGAWRKDMRRPPLPIGLLRHGLALASIDYRLSSHARFPAQVHDCKGAVRWLRANAGRFGYDAVRIGVAGSSAGGYLAAFLGTTNAHPDFEGDVGGSPEQSSSVSAVVDLFGPIDFTLIARPGLADTPEAMLLGAPISQNAELARLANPATHVSESTAPFLIFHGDADDMVSPEHSRALHRALIEQGIDSRLEIVAGAGHEAALFYDEARTRLMADFFLKHLAGTS